MYSPMLCCVGQLILSLFDKEGFVCLYLQIQLRLSFKKEEKKKNYHSLFNDQKSIKIAIDILYT